MQVSCNLVVAIGLFSSGIAFAQKENVCISCHLEQEEELKEVVLEWQKGIHFQNGISCESCHGGNSRDEDLAMEPSAGFVGVPEDAEIPSFCGKCHVAVKENYLKSAHGQILPTAVGAGFKPAPTCVACHTAHRQQRATLDLINEEECSRCHPFDRALKIRLVMSSTEAFITSLTSRIHRLTGQTMDTRRMEEELFATRNAFHRLTHVLSVDHIVSETGAIEEDLSGIERIVREKEGIVQRRNAAGLSIVILLLLSSIVMGLYRKTL